MGVLDSPQNAEVLDMFRRMIADGTTPSLSAMAATGVDPFANGEAAMTVSGHWSMIGYKEAPKDSKTGRRKIDWRRLGVAPMPHNGKSSLTVMYESGYAIPKRAKNKKLAWEFIKYMTSYAVQSKYQASGIAICGRKDVAQERAKDPLEAQFLPIIATARPPYGALIENYAFVEKQGQDAMNRVLQSGTAPRTALQIAAERIDKEFAKR
jgi:multiple sugar transport system substrate-binding protein